MLHIILFILKMIGMILLVILGLILLLAAIILFVPVRYKGRGSYHGTPEGEVKISWLLHIVSVGISYRETLDVRIRLFGIRILNNARTDSGEDMDFLEEDFVLSAQEIPDPAQTLMTDPKIEKQELLPLDQMTDPLPEGPRQELKPTPEETPLPPLPPVQEAPGKKSFFLKIKGTIIKWVKGFLASCRRFLASLKNAEGARQKLLNFIGDEKNKKTFHMLVKQAKKVGRHILPTKLRGHVVFGFEDPYVTGQILTGAALLYPLYHKQLALEPVFDRTVIEGELSFKGRLRLCVFAAAGIKILLDRNFRVQLKKFMNRGGL